jgi:hypothetical protein
MKLIRDYIEFKKRTRPIRDDFDLDIIPDGGLGRFLPERLNELTQYCADHPHYHIMSALPSAIKVNRAVPTAKFFLLAEGDSDPDLWFCDDSCQEVLIYSEILKFDRD